MMIKKIVSGGQTGPDLGSLYAAVMLGIETGGFCCQGWLNEEGEQRELFESFGMIECPRPGFAARTEMNVLTSDATLIIHNGKTGGKLSGGTYTTDCCCKSMEKPLMIVASEWLEKDKRVIDTFKDFCYRHKVEVLNCAGPRASKWADGQSMAMDWLIRALEENN